MFIDGKMIPNITCRRCRFRHPAEMSCQEAAEHAATERARREAINQEHAETLDSLTPMVDEVSHAAQWVELSTRAAYLGLAVTIHATDGFTLWDHRPNVTDRKVGTYSSFFDLRAGISDYVAACRTRGERL